MTLEVDLNDGNGYIQTGSTQLQSVPYALFASDVANKNDADADPTNEIQSLDLSNNALSISLDATAPPIDLSVYLDDTQLTEAEVDNMVSNNGYLTNEIDGSITNEIQTISISNDSLMISNGNSVDLSAFLDDTQLTETQVDKMVSNNGYLTSEVDGSITNEIQTISISNDSLSISEGNSIDLSAFLDNTDTQLTETQVDNMVANNGYLTNEVDGSITNELQLLTLSGNDLSISSGNAIDMSGFLDNTDTQLSEAQVDNFVSNNGYLTAELDGDVNNEIQNLSLSGTDLTISGGNTTDLSSLQDITII